VFNCALYYSKIKETRNNIGLALLCLCLLSACSEPVEYQPITKSVFAIAVVQAQGPTQRTLSGVVQSADQSVLSFEIPGVVDAIEVNLGDQIVKGQKLASIDNKVFRLAMEQSKARLSETNARLTEAKIDYQRKQQLSELGAISQAEVDIAKARFESLSDQVAIARTQVEIAQEDLDDTQLVAPFSGSIAIRHVELSQQVSPSSAVLTIQGSNNLEVAILVPESMIGQIQQEDQVSVDVLIDQKRQNIAGRIFEKGNQAQRANAFPVTIVLSESAMMSKLQPGMSAEVTFSMAQSNLPKGALQAPLSAIGADSDNTHFVMDLEPQENGQDFVVRKVPVTLLRMNAKHVVFMPEREVADIVRTGQEFLRDGQLVLKSNDPIRTINE
jgi:RND family efflux transporter MFP subunit